MAATVGDLAIRVGADVTDLKKGMARGSRTVGQFASKSGKQLRRTANSLAKVGTAAVAAGAAMVAGLVVKGSEVIDRQAKLARQLGTTQKSIAGLTRAAELSGVEQQQLEKNLGAYTKRLGEAMEGTGEAKKALDNMGLSAEKLSQMPLDQQMAVIAQEMNKMGTAAERNAAASDLFSRSGLQMINMFEGGGAAIKSAVREAEQFGLAVSDVDAAKVEAANDAMSAIGATIQGVANTLTIALAPHIQEVSERFGDAAKDSDGFKMEIQSLVNSSIKGFAKLADIIQSLRVVLKGVELVAVGFGGAFISAVQLAMEGFTAFNDQVNRVVNSIIRALNQIPNVNIGELGMMTDSDFMKDLRALGDSVRNKVGEVRGELHEMAMQEMPSAKAEEFLAAVAQRAQESAEKVVAARNKMIGMPEGETSGSSGMSQEEMDAGIERLRQKFATEEELQIEKYERDRELLQMALEAKRLTEEEHHILQQEALASHEDKLTEIEERAARQRQAVTEAEASARRRALGGMLSDLTTLMNSESKKQFEIGKKAAVAQTVISTYSSAQKAFYALADIPYVGPVLGAAAAAAAIAAGMQRVSAIRSQSFGGSGGSAVAASNTEAVNAASTPVGGGQAPGSGQTMRVEGLSKDSLFGGDAVQQIAQGLLDFQKDGGEVVFAQ